MADVSERAREVIVQGLAEYDPQGLVEAYGPHYGFEVADVLTVQAEEQARAQAREQEQRAEDARVTRHQPIPTINPDDTRYTRLSRALYPEERADLKESLRLLGCQSPIIVTAAGVPIDGLHRFLLWRELGRPIEELPITVLPADMEEGAIWALARDLNYARRHDSRKERTKRITELRSMGMSTYQIAQEVETSQSTVARAVREARQAGASQGDLSEPDTIPDSRGRRQPARKPRKPRPRTEQPELTDTSVVSNGYQVERLEVRAGEVVGGADRGLMSFTERHDADGVPWVLAALIAACIDNTKRLDEHDEIIAELQRAQIEDRLRQRVMEADLAELVELAADLRQRLQVEGAPVLEHQRESDQEDHQPVTGMNTAEQEQQEEQQGELDLEGLWAAVRGLGEVARGARANSDVLAAQLPQRPDLRRALRRARAALGEAVGSLQVLAEARTDEASAAEEPVQQDARAG